MGLHYYSSSSNIRIVCNCWIAFCLGSPSIIESIVIPVLWQRSHLNNHIIVIKSISLCRHPVPSPVFAFTELYLHTVVHVLAFNQRTMSGRADDRQTHPLLPSLWMEGNAFANRRTKSRPHHSSHSLSCYARPGWDGWWFYITATIQWYYTFFQMNHKVCVFKI